MSEKNEQIRKLIEQMVRKEVQLQLPRLVPQVIKEVMANMILESSVGVPEFQESARSSLHENVDDGFEEYPTMNRRTFDSSHLSQMIGGNQVVPPTMTRQRIDHSNLITIDSAMTENGNQVPISPSQIPAEVLKAMNKDYSALMSKLHIGNK